MKKTALRLLAVAAILAAVLTAAGCNTTQEPAPQMVEITSEIVSIDYPYMATLTSGLMAIFSTKDLTRISDLIVVGKATEQTKTSKSFVTSVAHPDKKGETVNTTYVYHMILHSFEVDEYLKGAGGKTIQIVTYDNDKHPAEPELERGQTYVLYLAPTNEGDREFHENAYGIQALGQGVWKIDGDEATQQFGDNKTAALSHLRKLAGARGNDDVENYSEYLDRAQISTEEITLPDAQLRSIADLIVRGAPTSEAQARKPPRYPADYPEYMREQDAELLKDAKVYSFSVSEYYKGQGPAKINIFTDGGEDYPFLDEGASYVLYLNDADFEAARAHYDGGGYVILASGQGTWKVKDGKATRQFGERETVDLSAFSP